MKKLICLVLITTTFGFSAFGCSSEDVREGIEKEKRAQELRKKSMERKPHEEIPVGDPFPSAHESPSRDKKE